MVVNYHNQGWLFCENKKYHSGMVIIKNTIDLEIDPDRIPAYAEAFVNKPVTRGLDQKVESFIMGLFIDHPLAIWVKVKLIGRSTL